MKVMSFNIRGCYFDDGENKWENRRDLNIATVLKHDADIICFQEVQRGNFDDYAEPLRAYDVEKGLISIEQTPEHHHEAISWKKDRFRKVDSGGFYLSETPELWSMSWTMKYPRAVTWVRLLPVAGDESFVVVNTHYPGHIDQAETRLKCSEVILEQLRTIAPASPLMVMADFNTTQTEQAYRIFLENGLVDTYTAAGHSAIKDVFTFHGFQGNAFPHRDGRLDWIVVRGFSTNSCTIIKDEAPPIYPGDHYPVLVDIEMK